ncbi:MAG: alpha/beta hydrolase [Spirochaetales bacterium]|nr:alpha/beta hydrolase [Spirochaetales bacterium]
MEFTLHRELYRDVPPEQKNRFFDFAGSFRLKSMETEGSVFRYFDGGKEGNPVLLVCTGGLKHPVFSYGIIDLFLEDFRVIAPVYPPEPNLERLLRGINRVLLELDIREAHCIGSSWGGCIAQSYAHLFPSSVKKLVLANTGMPSGFLYRFILRRYIKGLKEQKSAALLDGYRRQVLKLLSVPAEQAELWKAVIADLFPVLFTFRDYETLIRNQLDYIEDFVPEIAGNKSSIPCLVITSANETAGNRKMRKNLLSSYRSCGLKEFLDGGHAPPILYPEEYREAVTSFLREAT